MARKKTSLNKGDTNMKNSKLFTLLIVACLICSASIANARDNKQCHRVGADSTLLTISAKADKKVAPDIAAISAGIVTISPNAKKALAENSKKMQKVINALIKAGVENKDIQTSSMNISPNYVHRKNLGPKVKSYSVNNTVSVRLRDLEKVGDTIDALVSQGVNDLSGPHFSVENPDELIDQARTAALKKAQKRAKLYADAAGLKVKKIINLSERVMRDSPIHKRMMMRGAMEMSASSAPTPIKAGQVSLSVSINAEYELH